MTAIIITAIICFASIFFCVLFASDFRKAVRTMTKGTYTRDFYILPTVVYHNGDGIYKTLEFAWLKFYIGITW